MIGRRTKPRHVAPRHVTSLPYDRDNHRPAAASDQPYSPPSSARQFSARTTADPRRSRVSPPEPVDLPLLLALIAHGMLDCVSLIVRAIAAAALVGLICAVAWKAFCYFTPAAELPINAPAWSSD